MPKLAIEGFDGLSPRTSPTMLGDSMAQEASNVKLYARELRYWRGPLLTYDPGMADVETIFRLYGTSSDIWLTWDTDVDVALAPVADATDHRVYYTGDGTPKKTNYALASVAPPYPDGFLEMGVPAPTGAPTLAAVAGSAPAGESRAYVYTHVSTFGTVKEESGPSPAANVTIAMTQSVDVSGFSAVPAGDYNITHRRIYRSVTGASATAYEFVVELPVATATYNDDLLVAALGEDLATIGWTTPPATLTGLVSHPSGSLAGFVDNTIYFSEPFFPHAWPIRYALTVPYKIIGLGVFGTSLAVMTEAYPYIITGPYPGAFTQERVPLLEPCVSKTSITSDRLGVIYASPNGLVALGPDNQGLITTGLFTRDEWQTQLPASLKGAIYNDKYFGAYPGLTEQALVISRSDIPALSYLDMPADALHVDARESNLYYLDKNDGIIYQADAHSTDLLAYSWRSKRFVLPKPTTFSAFRLDADYAQITDDASYAALIAAIQAANAVLIASGDHGDFNGSVFDGFTLNGSALADLPPPGATHYARVDVYGDSVLYATFLPTSMAPLRLPPFKSRDLELRISGTLNVRSIALATTINELYSG